ncbi:hypothetical protein [Puia sp.]|jgi:hypothetical protein|uniref:hypothetical protein n=1 Tax=Puia sp. TaxID=2045100 RepID=UPI002F41D941
MRNKQKPPETGAQYAGTPPIQHSEVVLARQDAEQAPEKEKPSRNDDDIEADRHNGSGGAFEATEQERDEE